MSDDLRKRCAQEVRDRGANNVAGVIDAVLAVVDPDGLIAERDEAREAAVTLLDRGDRWRTQAEIAVRELAALRARVEYVLSIDADLHHQENASPDYWQGARDAHEWWADNLRALLADPTPEAGEPT